MSERDIFAAARERTDPAIRAAFLDAACAGDTALRGRVERLLQADATPDSIFDVPTANTPVVGDGVTRTIAPVVEESGGATRTHAPTPVGDPAYGETKAPDEGAADFDLGALLSPSQAEGSLGRLDHYEVLEAVGGGGMGVVLRAHDTKLRRVVALKLLAPALAAVGTARRRFAREAQSAAAVRDEHVVDIHEVCEDAAVPYLVMEFVAGVTLEDRVRSEGPLPLRELVRIGLQSARGLAAAHAQGLVHRDVKPGNILLEGEAGRVKLTDFGLARAADDASISRSGVIAGTPMYMSPEQAKGDHVDPRSDLFSLGSVLYTLCTGRPAFRAETTVAVLRRVCKENPRPIREVNPDVPKWVCAVVENLMAKDPADRIQSAAEVAELLARYLAHLEDPDRVPPPPAVRGVRVRDRRRVRRFAVAAVALVAIAALGVVGYRQLQPTEEASVAQTQAPEQPPVEKPPAGWKPPTAEELAARPSPLDGRTREQIPAGLPALAGGEAGTGSTAFVALLGESPFRVSPGGVAHWPTQSRDGALLALPHGNEVLLYDVATGVPVRSLTGGTQRAFRGAFSPDGKRFTSGDAEGTIRSWDLATGKLELTLRGHRGHIWAIVYAADGKRLASCGQDRAVKLWDAATGQELRTLPAHTGGAHHAAFTSDSQRLVTVGMDGLGKVWDAETGQLLQTLRGHTQRDVRQVVFSPDGKLLATGSESEVILWDPATWEPRHTLKSGGGGLLGFTPDGKTLVAAKHIHKAREARQFSRWDVQTGQTTETIALPGQGGLLVGLLTADGRTVFAMSCEPPDERIAVCDARSGKEALAHQGHVGSVWAVAASSDGRSIASGGEDKTVRLWDLGEWKTGDPQPPSRVLAGHTAGVYSVAFSPDCKLVASGSQDGTVRLWDAATGAVVRTLQAETCKNPSDVAFSTDGKLVAIGAGDGSVRLWDVVSGEAQSPLRWHTQQVNSVAFGPDAKFLASAGLNDRKVYITDLKTFRRVQTLGPSGEGVVGMKVAFGGDGRTLAYGGWDATVHLWDLVDKKETVLTGGPARLDGLTVDPTGRLVAASGGGAVRVWDRTTPDRPGVIRPGPFGTTVRSVAFTPEGRYLVVAGANGTVSILRTPLRPSDAGPASTGLDSLDPKEQANLGVALLQKGQWDGAIARFRKAIELDPNYAFAHGRLGVALMNKNQWDEAEASIRKAIELDPKLATAHHNLAVALDRKNQLDDAIVSWRKAAEIEPKFTAAHFSLGLAFLRKNQWDEAIVSYRKVLELDPKNSAAHNNLGHALSRKGQADEAIAGFRKAIEFNPKNAVAHTNLGYGLLNKGQYDESVANFRNALEINPQHAPARNGMARALSLKVVHEQFPAFLKGEFKPTTNEERLGLVELCMNKKLYRAAANLSTDIFAADSKLADNLATALRYNAACSAALAAAGKGEDAAKLDDTEKTRLRKLALDWLRADLVLRTKQLESDRAAVQAALKHWQLDGDLAGIRDAAALEKLPAEERAEFTKLWADVAELLKKAAEAK